MYRLLKARETDPVRVAVIGAGKFSSMFLAQVRTTPGMRVVGVCDLAPERARATLRRSGWSVEEIAAIGLFPDVDSVIGHGDPEVVVEATGEPLHVWHARQVAPTTESRAVLQIVLMPAREAVYAACDARFERMIADGVVEEARAVRAMQLDPGLPVMKAVGLAPLLAHCANMLPLEDAVAAGKRDTKRYARRQMTWFRNRSRPDRVFAAQYSESLLPEIFSFISDWRLTLSR